MKVGNGTLQSMIMQDKVPVSKEKDYAEATKKEGNVFDPGIGKPIVNGEDLIKAVEEMNQAMDLLNRGLKFKVHEGTEQIMVKIVNHKTDEVLKEIPSEEMLDLMAKIRETVGLLVDKYV